MAKRQAERIDKYSWAVEGARVLIKSYSLLAGEYGTIASRPSGDAAIIEFGAGQREYIPLKHLEQIDKTNREYLSLAEVAIDGGTQSRAKLNLETVDDYALDLAAGAEFPPVEVYYDGERYWLADGFHRLAAYKKNQELDPDNGTWQNIAAKIHQGDRRDAILHSVGANSNHGLRRTNADKRRAVTTLLVDKEWSQWSNREIAKACGVSLNLVNTLRKESSELKVQIGDDRLVTRNGKTYTMNTAQIGKAASVGCPDGSMRRKGKSDIEDNKILSGPSNETRQVDRVEIIHHAHQELAPPPMPANFKPNVDRVPLPEVWEIADIKPITSEERQLADDVTIGLKSNIDILSPDHIWAIQKALTPRLNPEELELASIDWSDAELLDLLKNSQIIIKAVKQMLNKRHHPEYFKVAASSEVASAALSRSDVPSEHSDAAHCSDFGESA